MRSRDQSNRTRIATRRRRALARITAPIAVFVLLATLLSVAYHYPYRADGAVSVLLTEYLAGYARVVGWVLSCFDPAVHVIGPDVIGRFSLRVSRDCDGMSVMILLTAAVIAFPTTWRRRLAGVTAGIALVAVINVLRLCTMYYIGVWWPDAFEFAHVEAWPILLTGSVFGMFLVWKTWVSGAARSA